MYPNGNKTIVDWLLEVYKQEMSLPRAHNYPLPIINLSHESIPTIQGISITEEVGNSQRLV